VLLAISISYFFLSEDGIRFLIVTGVQTCALPIWMGGISRFVQPGDRILLKANLLRPVPPEAAVCTHPAVIGAIAKLIREAGGTEIGRASCRGRVATAEA